MTNWYMTGLAMTAVGRKNYGVMIVGLICSNAIIQYLHMRETSTQFIQKMQQKKFMDEAKRDKERNEENVADIIVEDCNIPNSIPGGTDMSEKYLRITMHDNDFITSLSLLANILYNIFINEERFPEEDEFSLLGKYIQPLLFSLHNIRHIMRSNKNIIGFSETLEKYFEPALELVDGCDIPDWDDCESVYIPMFTNGKILIR